MGRSACARLPERAGRASGCFDKVGALCLIAPMAASLVLRALSTLAELYSQYIDTPQPSFMPTSACRFALCIVILVAITITSRRPYKRNTMVPSHVLHLPFNPVQVVTFTSPQCHINEQAPPVLRRMPRSGSHPCLSSHYQLRMSQNENAPKKASTTGLVRSPSHNTFLTGKPLHPRHSASVAAAESLSDEEINCRFSAFIESRFAAMKREMVE